MVLAAFERILNDPEKMAFYNNDPVLRATFLALYEYKKSGGSFSELDWFAQPGRGRECRRVKAA